MRNRLSRAATNRWKTCSSSWQPSAERRHKRKHGDKKDTDTKRNWFAGAIGKKGKKDKKDKKGRKDKKSGRKAARKGKGSKSRRGKKKKK